MTVELCHRQILLLRSCLSDVAANLEDEAKSSNSLSDLIYYYELLDLSRYLFNILEANNYV